MIAPILEEIANEMSDKVKVTKMDVDANKVVASKFNIMSIPSLLMFKSGKMVDQVVGAVPKSQLVSRLEKALA
jgi:thioredoxin 1